MATLAAIDLSQVAQGLGLSVSRVEAVVELLDEGNTVPFITRYRKDQTGGLDEEQIRQIQARTLKLRMLFERKQTILRSIEAQGKLTPELAEAIQAADTTRRLEDLYLPFKPKKQTLATTARDRGLEPLASEILAADALAQDLDSRAADFVNSDRKVFTPADALLGAGHILAELFSERVEVRERLRAIFERTAKLVSTGVESEGKEKEGKEKEKEKTPREKPARSIAATTVAPPPAVVDEPTTVEAAPAADPVVADAPAEMAVEVAPAEVVTTVAPVAEEAAAAPSEPADAMAAAADAPAETDVPVVEPAVAETTQVEQPSEEPAQEEVPAVEVPAVEVPAASTVEVAEPAAAQPAKQPPLSAKALAKKKKEEAKKRKAERELRLFRDYFNYREELAKVPPHRVLAINRGEKVKALRVRFEVDLDAMHRVLDELLVPAEHPHAEFLRGCARDALHRLVLPSLEREVRRELTDMAEWHAVEVFARNLRKLLLQPPIRGRRLLAVDPGFKSGCKLAAVDEFGQLLESAVVWLIGKEERRAEATLKAVELIKNHQLSVVAIGNGTGCRDTERWVSELIGSHLADQDVAYVIVNEAGASVYSTSRLGREELPHLDATVRSAVSIGRRLLDPLSELVKIEPASIGVGMYQHDLKGKHLKESLDAVVESCVNFVGVDLNTASPALLRYVSGLNQLTAQRLFDHRTASGPFRSREQLKDVTGFGEGTFVQAAGFLKIVGGDNPLDATWIHPESYAVAEQVLKHLDGTPADLADKDKVAQLAERAKQLQIDQLAAELNIGALTLADIVAQLSRPGRDPRESLPPPVFKHHVLKLDDLVAGMELSGTVLNVVDFGAFVDIGLKDSGLVHISQLADRYVQDPHEVVSVGDVVRVWVMEVDKQRRRVSLTMIDPAARKPAEARRGRGAEEQPAGHEGRRPPRDAQAQRRPRGGRPVQGAEGGPSPKRHGGKGKRPKFKPAAVQYEAKPSKVPDVKLTKAKREGRAPLQTFGELFKFISEKQEKPGHGEGGEVKPQDG